MNLPPELLVASGFGLAAALVVWALNDYFGTSAITRRARALDAAGFAQDTEKSNDFRSRFLSAVRSGPVDRFLGADRLSQMLIRSGARSREALNGVLFMKFAMPFAGFWLGWQLNPISYLIAEPAGLVRAAGGVLACIASFFVPDLIVHMNMMERRRLIRSALPDTIDLFYLSIQAGMSLENAIPRTIPEIQRRSPELADELRVMAAEIAYLPERRMAFENFKYRCSLAEVDELTVVIQQADRYGTSLGDALRQLSESTRTRQMLELERKALQLPAKLTVPIMGFLLPGIVVMIFAPMLLGGFLP